MPSLPQPPGTVGVSPACLFGTPPTSLAASQQLSLPPLDPTSSFKTTPEASLPRAPQASPNSVAHFGPLLSPWNPSSGRFHAPEDSFSPLHHLGCLYSAPCPLRMCIVCSDFPGHATGHSGGQQSPLRVPPKPRGALEGGCIPLSLHCVLTPSLVCLVPSGLLYSRHDVSRDPSCAPQHSCSFLAPSSSLVFSQTPPLSL